MIVKGRFILAAIWITFIIVLGYTALNKVKQTVDLLDFESKRMEDLLNENR
jgi:hypothetical protein